MKITTWNIEQMTGYKPISTYYEDFSIADKFGTEAIKDTYKSAIKGAKSFGYKYLTELVMALNWKIWEHYDTNHAYGILYNTLWQSADRYAVNTLKGEELEYYFRTID